MTTGVLRRAPRTSWRDEFKLKKSAESLTKGNVDLVSAGVTACLEGLLGDRRASPPDAGRSVGGVASRKEFVIEHQRGTGISRAVWRPQGPMLWTCCVERGRLFDFPALVGSCAATQAAVDRSEARVALQLKFVIRLEFGYHSNVTDQAEAQFIWRYNPRGSSEFVNDWDRGGGHPSYCVVMTENRQAAGTGQRVDLSNVQTYGRARSGPRFIWSVSTARANDLARPLEGECAPGTEKGPA